MENDKITEELRKFAETFKNAQTERKAIILIPTHDGFMVHEVTKEIGLHAVAAQALKDKAEAECPNEESGLGLQHVSNNEVAVCKHRPKSLGRMIQCELCGKILSSF
jgi:hypothetical protein